MVPVLLLNFINVIFVSLCDTCRTLQRHASRQFDLNYFATILRTIWRSRYDTIPPSLKKNRGSVNVEHATACYLKIFNICRQSL